MNSSTITITPELAREYLAKNIDKNRPIRNDDMLTAFIWK